MGGPPERPRILGLRPLVAPMRSPWQPYSVSRWGHDDDGARSTCRGTRPRGPPTTDHHPTGHHCTSCSRWRRHALSSRSSEPGRPGPGRLSRCPRARRRSRPCPGRSRRMEHAPQGRPPPAAAPSPAQTLNGSRARPARSTPPPAPVRRGLRRRGRPPGGAGGARPHPRPGTRPGRGCRSTALRPAVGASAATAIMTSPGRLSRL